MKIKPSLRYTHSRTHAHGGDTVRYIILPGPGTCLGARDTWSRQGPMSACWPAPQTGYNVTMLLAACLQCKYWERIKTLNILQQRQCNGRQQASLFVSWIITIENCKLNINNLNVSDCVGATEQWRMWHSSDEARSGDISMLEQQQQVFSFNEQSVCVQLWSHQNHNYHNYHIRCNIRILPFHS